MGKMNNINKISLFFATLIVKFTAYFAVSCVFILLFWWARIIKAFSWRYVLVMAIGLLFLRIFISEVMVRPNQK